MDASEKVDWERIGPWREREEEREKEKGSSGKGLGVGREWTTQSNVGKEVLLLLDNIAGRVVLRILYEMEIPSI